jgi:hypothetical protein
VGWGWHWCWAQCRCIVADVLTIAASVQRVPAVSLCASKRGIRTSICECGSCGWALGGRETQMDAIVMMRLVPNTAEMSTTSSHLAVNTDIEFIIH